MADSKLQAKNPTSSIPLRKFTSDMRHSLKKEKTVSCPREYNSLTNKDRRTNQDVVKSQEARTLSKITPTSNGSPSLLGKKTHQSIVCKDKRSHLPFASEYISIDITKTPEKPQGEMRLIKEKTRDSTKTTTKMRLLKKTKLPTQLNTKAFMFNIFSIGDRAKQSLGTSQEISVDSDYFDYSKEKQLELTNDEKGLYGLRELPNYQKVKILGKGGCGIVWFAIDKSGNEFAIKQIIKKCKSAPAQLTLAHNAQIAKREIEMLAYLTQLPNKGDSMVSYKGFYENSNDIWIIFEKGGYSLSNLSFKIKGEFLNSERVYAIKKGFFLQKMMTDLNQFKNLIKSMLSFVQFMSELGIVHSDIKPDNILITYDKELLSIQKIKVIDFGSAFFIANPLNFASNTPEYMSPEITALLEKSASSKEIIKFIQQLAECPSCIDMWSLGVSLLEIALACPLWMSYKAKVVIRNRIIYKTGLFGFKGRDGNKIYSKQVEVSQSIGRLLEDSLFEDYNERSSFADLLQRMLEIDYLKRITPSEALKHPFLK